MCKIGAASEECGCRFGLIGIYLIAAAQTPSDQRAMVDIENVGALTELLGSCCIENF